MVILVVAVIVLGPERLPEAMRTLGKMARELRKITDDFSDVRNEFTRDFREELERDSDAKKKGNVSSAQRRARAGRAGQDIPDIDRIRAERAAAEDAEVPALADGPDRAVDAQKETSLPTLKPAAGAVAAAQATDASSPRDAAAPPTDVDASAQADTADTSAPSEAETPRPTPPETPDAGGTS